jgi:Holliday junction DNA helicase RuvA
MIYSIAGKLQKKENTFAVIECNGIGYKIAMAGSDLKTLPPLGGTVLCFCSLRVKEESLDLYGFLNEAALRFFELLTTVNGVGPRTALAILDIDSLERIMAAILEKRVDLLLRASGIGKKTAERVILELQNKLDLDHTGNITKHMTTEIEVEDALVGLGYARHEAHAAANTAGKENKTFETQLRDALKYIGSKNKK